MTEPGLALDFGDERPGFRLQRVEVLGWGTFDRAVWQFDLDGTTSLLTGDIGSGKSTLVDAITTLMLPAQRVSYNKAAGAETRERSLRSYVAGYYKSERNETTGQSRPVALRDHRSHSVLLAVFRHEQLDQEVTLAQVFWLPEGTTGQPRRFHLVAHEALTIPGDLTDFGSDITELRRRLRRRGLVPMEHFPDYERAFRRALGVPSRQAMELFHQTVSLKSVGNLTDFVRAHMLEPFDTQQSVRALVEHFDDLSASHDAVLRAREQLRQLEPVITLADQIEAAETELGQIEQERRALRYAGAQLTLHLLTADQARAQADQDHHQGALTRVTDTLRQLRSREQGLRDARAGHAGGRLGQLEAQLERHTDERTSRAKRHATFEQALRAAGLNEMGEIERFAPTRQEAEQVRGHVVEEVTASRAGEAALAVERAQHEADARQIREELTSLSGRRTSIPMTQLTLRQRLCDDLGLPEDELPYAGELVQVRHDQQQWLGAAERVLRGFALSLVVPDRHYEAVAAWVDGRHLGGRLVYYRVRHGSTPSPAEPDAGTLADRLEVRPGQLADWIRRELAHRADHQCVDTVAELRRVHRGVTRNGQVKSGSRHEKDDRRRLDDASTHVLGWDNQAKVDALLERAQAVQQELTARDERRRELTEQQRGLDERLEALAVVLRHDDPTDLDWWSSARRVASLEADVEQLRSESAELEQIEHALHEVSRQIESTEAERSHTEQSLGAAVSELDTITSGIAEASTTLSDQPEDLTDAVERAHAQLTGGADNAEAEPGAARLVPTRVQAAGTRLGSRATEVATRLRSDQVKAVRLMVDFRHSFPAETVDQDASIAALPEYRQLRDRVARDDLPRFEAEFKRYLNENSIREIAQFQARLHQQERQISDRIGTINDSLHGIDYNPNRYIRLDPHPTPSVEVREFRAQLRACTENILGEQDELYSETKFAQVEAIISRFRGREGHADADRAWTLRVTDVRNWLVFGASERWRETNQEHETYADSDGKSGGQKEKLAYTILAASLAYQFRLDDTDPLSRTFRFAVIDEAFGRGSDESTRYALRLFRTLGLQLLVITPLQKVHTIEPFVERVAFVDNPSGASSRLHTMTISQYREQRSAHTAAKAGLDSRPLGAR